MSSQEDMMACRFNNESLFLLSGMYPTKEEMS